MYRRLALMVMLLALAAVAVPLHADPAAPVEPTGIKAAGEIDGDTPELPATTTIGMLITVLLVMGASTMTLLGGGIKNAVNTMRGNTPPPVTAPAQPAPVAESEAQAEPLKAKQAKKSPKNKSRRTVAQQRAFEQRRQQMRMAQRGATKAPLRKRGGPGCRGVR